MSRMTCNEFSAAIMRKKSYDHQDVMETPLERCLRTYEIIFIGIAVTVTGAFSLPGLIIMEAGPSAVLTFLISGITVIVIAMPYVEFCCRLPRAGSTYSYNYVTIGELPAFFCGWSIILVYLLSIGGCAKAFSATIDVVANNSISNYFQEAIPNWPSNSSWLSPYPDFVAGGAVIVAMCIVLAGAEISVWVMGVAGGVSLSAMTVVIVVLFMHADPANLSPPEGFAPNGVPGLLKGAATSFVIFTGFDAMTIASEEVKNPTKTIPFAVFFSLGFSIVYLIISTFALVLFVPYTQVSSPAVAFSVALNQRGIYWAAYVGAAGSIVGMGAVILVAVYALPRVIYSIAQDGLLFGWLGTIWQRTKVPGYAVLLSNMLGAIFSVVFSYSWFTNTGTIAAILAYVSVSLCVMVLRFSKPKHFLDQTTKLRHFDTAYRPLAEQDDTEDTEETPLVQETEESRVGKLKPCAENLPLAEQLKKADPGVVPLAAYAVFSLFAIGFCIIAIYGAVQLSDGVWWIVLLFTVFAVVMLLLIAIMLLFQRSDKFIKTFKMPAVPVIPCIAMLFGLFLICSLASSMWLGYLLWLIIGVVIYFSYGMWHSVEAPQDSPTSLPEPDAKEN